MGLGIADNRFKTKPPRWAFCSVCKDVAKTPTELSCKHIFCFQCIESLPPEKDIYGNLTQRCPEQQCRKWISNEDMGLMRNLQLRNLYNDIVVYCEHRVSLSDGQGGCNIEEKIETLSSHEERCVAKLRCQIKGVNSCDRLIARKDLATHDCVEALKRHVSTLENEAAGASEVGDLLEKTKQELERMRVEKDEHRRSENVLLKYESVLKEERSEYLSCMDDPDPKTKLKMAILQNWGRTIIPPQETNEEFWKHVMIDSTSGVIAEVNKSLRQAECPSVISDELVKQLYYPDYADRLMYAKKSNAKYTARNLRSFQSSQPKFRLYVVLHTDNSSISDAKLSVPYPGFVIVRKR